MPDSLKDYVYPSFVALDVTGASGVYMMVDVVDLTLANGDDMQVNITRTYVRGTDKLTQTQTLETSDDLSLDVAVPSGAADQLIPCSFDSDALKVLFVLSDVDMSLKTNDSVTPADELTLKAGVPIVWTENSGELNPLSADITSLYATNAGPDDGTLQVRLSL